MTWYAIVDSETHILFKFIHFFSALFRHARGSTMSSSTAPNTSVFNKERHIKYWLRCLKTFLPTAYISNDSNRMTLAYFTLSALDSLGALESHTTPVERAQYVDWIYHCQHPSGGFRGFTGTDLGALRDEGNAHWDPANMAATFFALASLAVLGDGLDRVRRRECLEWLARLQRGDGSFGETLGEEGRIEGGRDTRFCSTAAGIRWMLRGGGSNDPGDIDVEGLLRYIKSTEVYDPAANYIVIGESTNTVLQRHMMAASAKAHSSKPMVRPLSPPRQAD